jgi:hypothetical protein
MDRYGFGPNGLQQPRIPAPCRGPQGKSMSTLMPSRSLTLIARHRTRSIPTASSVQARWASGQKSIGICGTVGRKCTCKARGYRRGCKAKLIVAIHGILQCEALHLSPQTLDSSRLMTTLSYRSQPPLPASSPFPRYSSASYRFPLNAHTPQFPALTSPGSASFKSHLRLLNRFSPCCNNRSASPFACSFTHAISRCMSKSV